VRRFNLVVLFMLSACTQPVPIEDETATPPLPEASYAEAARAGASVYRILPQESLLLVRVGRSGPMQRFGHEHAVASEDVLGLVEINSDPSASRAHIVLPIRNLVVDKPEYRERLGLDTGPSTDDVAKTYTNMLKVFEPQLYPWVLAEARITTTQNGRSTLAASITLHGSTFKYLLPVELEVDAEQLVVSGQATIRHSDFGVTPFAAAGGLVRVADELEVQFRLVGRAKATMGSNRTNGRK
jgi:hypothetical protein